MPHDRTNADAVIVGGGIAGCALAYSLASAGRRVMVLERTDRYRDRVRGEGMHVWGVREAQRLGVEETLRAAGGRIVPQWHRYREGDPNPVVVPMAELGPDTGGTLSISHPIACQALLETARHAGARVQRGVTDVRLDHRGCAVRYRTGNGSATCSAPIIIGADGRASTIRRQAGIVLDHEPATTWIAGMLLSHPVDVPHDVDVIADGTHPLVVLNHQSDHTTRAYLVVGHAAQHRYAGPGGPNRFLADLRTTSYPWAAALADATPVGPCATYPGDDTWTANPTSGPVVLIGDAAGHTDPIMGQGLSIALRDARLVRDAILAAPAGRTPDFTPYAAERLARLERLRLAANIVAAFAAEDADNRQARLDHVAADAASANSKLQPVLLGAFIGPEHVPDEAVDHTLPDMIRAA